MRLVPRLLLFATLAAASPRAQAEDNLTLQELRALRQLVEAQSRQIEQLNLRVARLSAIVEGKAVAPAAPAAPAEFQVTVTTPAAEVPPDDGQLRHIVVKGENLTTISKKHNVTPEDIQKANKIADPKKLQIGQSLIIPKPAEAQSTEKKP